MTLKKWPEPNTLAEWSKIIDSDIREDYERDNNSMAPMSLAAVMLTLRDGSREERIKLVTRYPNLAVSTPSEVLGALNNVNARDVEAMLSGGGAEEVEETVAPAPKRRGRPPGKAKLAAPAKVNKRKATEEDEEEEETPAPKRRGRPPGSKNKSAAAPVKVRKAAVVEDDEEEEEEQPKRRGRPPGKKSATKPAAKAKKANRKRPADDDEDDEEIENEIDSLAVDEDEEDAEEEEDTEDEDSDEDEEDEDED